MRARHTMNIEVLARLEKMARGLNPFINLHVYRLWSKFLPVPSDFTNTEVFLFYSLL